MVMTGYTNAQIKDWSSIQKELADTSNDKLLNRITRTNLRSLDKQKVDHAGNEFVEFENIRHRMISLMWPDVLMTLVSGW